VACHGIVTKGEAIHLDRVAEASRVKANKGSPGVDGMTVEELPDYLKQEILPTTRRSTCSIVLRDCGRTPTE